VTQSALYNRDILRLASSLAAGDSLHNPDGSAEARSPICGSRIQADISITPDGVIAAIALRANACALGQASAALLRTYAIGKDIEAIAGMRSDIADGLNGRVDMQDIRPEFMLLMPARDYPSRHAAILLPYDAVLAAAATLKISS
jgi:NifU-like protein involved in Fe-S cluster formation